MKKKNSASCGHLLRVGSHIRKWRVIRDIKQKDLARSLGLSVSAVSNLENDISIPNLQKVEHIANALFISIDMLLDGPEKLLGKQESK